MAQGKGYPDLATKVLIRSLLDHPDWEGEPPPVFGLVDYDPDGLCILKNYRHGSKSLAQEHKWNIPEMLWLAVRPDHDFLLGEDDDTVVLRLTARDRGKARSMLENDLKVEQHALLDGQSRQALQNMLMLNIKMEIQIPEPAEVGKAWLTKMMADCLS